MATFKEEWIIDEQGNYINLSQVVQISFEKAKIYDKKLDRLVEVGEEFARLQLIDGSNVKVVKAAAKRLRNRIENNLFSC